MKTNYVFVTPRRERTIAVWAHVGWYDITRFAIARPQPYMKYIPNESVLIAEECKSIGRIYLN